MTYENLNAAFSTILLEKDPRDHTYHPRVVRGSKAKGPDVLNLETDTSNLEEGSPVKKARGKYPHTDHPMKLSGGRSCLSPGPVVTCKKRARQGATSPKQPSKGSTMEGKRQVDKRAEEKVDSQPKKGRTSGSFLPHIFSEQAGAVEQPQPTQ
jgi:hypothetical protein